MTTQDRKQDRNQFDGDAANFANTARAQLSAFIDNLEQMVSKGRDLLVDMDARLEDFDGGSRRLTETETEKREKVRAGTRS
jgi:hypothetical protein